MSLLPLVTIITPAYNRAGLIVETIESVLSQNYPNLEYLVLDDGSTDNTLEIVKRYEGRLRWESHPNMGETRTVNKGFRQATGEIIGVVNSDDPLLPNAVHRIVETFSSRPNLMVAYPDWKMIDEEGSTLEIMECKEFTGLVDMVRKHYCLPGPGAFFRREVIEKTGGRDPQFRYVGDTEFWFRSGLFGEFARIPEVLATHRIHSGSATVGDVGTVMAEEHIKLVDKFFSSAKIPADVRAIEREAYSSANFFAGCACSRWALVKKLCYFFKAIINAPDKYFGENKSRWGMILLTCCGFSRAKAFLSLNKIRKFLDRA